MKIDREKYWNVKRYNLSNNIILISSGKEKEKKKKIERIPQLFSCMNNIL